MDSNWTEFITGSGGAFGTAIAFGFFVFRGYLRLGREYDNAVIRAERAEARADRFENLALKGKEIAADSSAKLEDLEADLRRLSEKYGVDA